MSHSNTKPRILAIIPARGGSKGVQKKNVRELNGHPLIAYTICEALRSDLITRLVVSSDDDDIRHLAIKYGAEAPFRRPAELSTDTARPVDCHQHALKWCEDQEKQKYDYIVEIMCTNPMKTVEDINAALSKIIETNADSVIAVCKLEDHHPIRIKKIVEDRIVDFCLPEISESRRQDLKPDAYIRNGSIYAMRRDMLVRGIRYGTGNSRPYIMPRERTVNIDEEMDFVIAQMMMEKQDRYYVKPAMSDEEARNILKEYEGNDN